MTNGMLGQKSINKDELRVIDHASYNKGQYKRTVDHGADMIEADCRLLSANN